LRRALQGTPDAQGRLRVSPELRDELRRRGVLPPAQSARKMARSGESVGDYFVFADDEDYIELADAPSTPQVLNYVELEDMYRRLNRA
jgi:hypothetical protein